MSIAWFTACTKNMVCINALEENLTQSISRI